MVQIIITLFVFTTVARPSADDNIMKNNQDKYVPINFAEAIMIDNPSDESDYCDCQNLEGPSGYEHQSLSTMKSTSKSQFNQRTSSHFVPSKIPNESQVEPYKASSNDQYWGYWYYPSYNWLQNFKYFIYF